MQCLRRLDEICKHCSFNHSTNFIHLEPAKLQDGVVGADAAKENINGTVVPLKPQRLLRQCFGIGLHRCNGVADDYSCNSQMQQGLELVITQGTVLMQNLICLCSWLLSTLFNLLRLSYDFLGLAASKARSVFWKITMIIYPQMKLGLEIVITQGTVLMHNLICLCSWLISSLFNIVRLSYDFLVLAASEASSVFWKITMIIYPQMKLGLEIVLTQVTVLMQNLICLCLWLISNLFTAVRLGWDFLVLATSEASLFCWRLTMVIYSQMQLGLELVITP